MSDYVRPYDDGAPQQVRVEATTGFVEVFDEPTDPKAERVLGKTTASVLLTNGEARWLRDVLNGLDLGDAKEPA